VTDLAGVAAAVATLAKLRWNVDSRVINHDGEDVWLCAAYDAAGRRIGIEDCCFAADPCDHHAALGGKEPPCQV
jgi:hypothetical protein